MTNKRVVGILILACLTSTGCRTESERMADFAHRTVESQNDVNATLAKSNENTLRLHREIQQERSGLQRQWESLNGQYDSLERNRRDLHRERRSELAWSESFRFLALMLAAAMPLFLCAYLIWMATQSSVKQEEVNSILIHELVSAEPRLISAPNLPVIPHVKTEETAQSKTESQQQK